jgi:hypothetical protein
MMHLPIHEQGLYLKRVVNRYFNYYAVPPTTVPSVVPCAEAAKPDQAANMGANEAADGQFGFRPLASGINSPTCGSAS